MLKIIKTIGIIFSALVLAAGALLLAARALITPEKINQMVISLAQNRLNRPVSIGDTQLHIFSGIVFSDFLIGSKDGAENFLSADSLVMKYRLWPLLRFSVVIDEIRLDSPEIRIERYKNGDFNFSDLLGSTTGDPDRTRESSGVQVNNTNGGPEFDLTVNEISVSNGRVVIMDYMQGENYKLTDFSVSASIDNHIKLDLVSKVSPLVTGNKDSKGILISASGNILSYEKDPELDMTVRLEKTSLSNLLESLPENLENTLAEMTPTGNISAYFDLKGSLNKPEEIIDKGEITLENVGVVINHLTPEISGDILIANDTASSENLLINLESDLLRLNFIAKNILGKVLYIDKTLNGDKLNIDRMFALMGRKKTDLPSPPSEKTSSKPPPQSEEPGPFDIPAQIKGNVKISSAIYQGLNFTDVDLQYLLKDNILTINQINGNLAGGKISGSAKGLLNRKPVAYTANFSVEGTRAEKVLNAIFPAASNTVFGTTFMKSDIRGEGLTPDTIHKRLTADADVIVKNGKLSGKGFAEGLAVFLDVEKLKVLEFESFKGNMKLKDGDIKLDSRFMSNEIRMTPKGIIGLDGSLKLSLGLYLAPSIASKIQFGKFYPKLLQTRDGWSMVPITVDGTLRKPNFSLDTSVLSDQFIQRGTEEFGKQLQDKLLEKMTPKSTDKRNKEPDKKEKAAPEKILQDMLQRLFESN